MRVNNIAFVINAHHPYIRHVGEDGKKYAQENTLLFEKISTIFIPLLNMFANLEKENISFKIAMSFSSPLCTLLCDDEVCEQYVSWLDSLIEFGKKEIARHSDNPELLRNAKESLDAAEQNRHYFVDVYEQNLLKYFSLFAKKGYIEILATAGTYMFMPYFADESEILNAQVEMGLYSTRHFFGVQAEGFFLPEMGFTPGLENVLKMYGVSYTILPAMSFLFSPTIVKNGIYGPARCQNYLSIFPSDYESISYSNNSSYKNHHMDIAFELEANKLEPFIKKGEPRRPSGFCYWNNKISEENAETDEESKKLKQYFYDSKVADLQIDSDAENFILKAKQKFEKASETIENPTLSLTEVLDTDSLGKKWYEGIKWLEKVIKKGSAEGFTFTSFSDLLIDKFDLQKIETYPGAKENSAYGEELLSNKNGWMMRYLRKSGERIVDLTERFPNDTGLKARLLNLGSRELMIAQSSEWARMIEEDNFAEYAEKRFQESILSFTAVFDALGSNTVSTEWLCNLERNHPIFPWMNYRIFSRKK